MPRQRRIPGTSRPPRGARYAAPPPEHVRDFALSELLPPWRAISAEQQARLAADDDSPLAIRRSSLRLWCAGDVSLLRGACVAVVGTREPSEDGGKRARKLGRELATAGVVVVSGLARGIDTHALNAAIEAGGRVIGVIGTPLDQATPSQNRPLQERIYREHLLLSQFPFGAPVGPANFPRRNRVMATVSDATAIVEASDDSGALHQARECTLLGRWLFICRSVTEDPKVTWSASFLKHSRARVLTDTRQILEALRESGVPAPHPHLS